MKKYEINCKTMALVPCENKTVVYEEDDSFTVDQSIKQIMEDSCLYYGSTLSGRKKCASKILNSTYKTPIVVEESSNLIFFPTASPRLDSCIWIALNKISNYYKVNDGLLVRFKGNKSLKINKSYHIIDTQVLRATRLGCILEERKIKSEKNVKK